MTYLLAFMSTCSQYFEIYINNDIDITFDVTIDIDIDYGIGIVCHVMKIWFLILLRENFIH